ncbi:MAG TPA: DUF4340 domain-containing protein [Spirochaetia bacterium]|nr:DUF4340 domain-containing protein [Spirochaetia bacterium]
MTRRSWTLVGVLAVVVVLVGVYVLVTRTRPAAAAKAPEQIALSKGDKAKILRVSLTDRTEGPLVMDRKAGKWSTEPALAVALDDTSIDNLLDDFAGLSAQRVIEEKPVDLAQFGLAPPRATATATWEDGTSHTLLLGDKAPSGSSYYIQVKGDPRVYSVESYNAQHFHWTLKDIRSRAITPAINWDEVAYVKLTEPNGTVIEVRRKLDSENKSFQLGFGQFLMTRPYRLPRGLDSQKQDTVVKGAQAVSIADFADEPLKPLSAYGLDRPRAEVVVRDKSNTLDLVFGTQKDTQTWFAVRGQPGVYLADNSSLDFLKTKPFDVIDKFSFIPNIEDVDRLDITAGGKTHTLAITRTVKKAANAPAATNVPSGPNAQKPAEPPQDEVTSTYTADGKTVEEDSFKKFYQAVIGLQIEGETSKRVADAPEVSTTYYLNKGDAKTVKVDYAPYDRDFDAIFVDGTGEFALTKGQLDKMVAKLNLLVTGQKVPD